MRTVLTAVCAGALAAAFASSAGAVQPERTVYKGSDGDAFFDFPAGVVCSFHWTAQFTQLRGVDLVFSNGVEMSAYTYVVEITNVDTGESRVLREAGTITYTDLGNDLVETTTTGRELSLFFPGDLGPGSPGALIFIIGQSREVDEVPGPNPNPFGFTTQSFEVLSGKTENLCETMA
jgi:hypothetical protein